MGTISIINTDRLYWLGRYSERVYTTLRVFSESFDALIEQTTQDYAQICRQLDIPNIYSDKDDFIARYAFSMEDPNSIISNLTRAYDNAIELRDEIGSETLAYIQMAMYSLQKAGLSQAPLIDMMGAMDDILAFWGIVDDQIDDENIRNIIKVGKRVERLDLYARMHLDVEKLNREICRLAGRIDRCSLQYRKESIAEMRQLISQPEIDYPALVTATERILEA